MSNLGGRAIQQFGPRGGWVDLDGQRMEIKAKVHTLAGYSAHADQADLLRFATGMKEPPKVVRLVHGDAAAKLELQRLLQAKQPNAQVVVP